MISLTKEHILIMHEKLIDRYGGTHGIRDESLLDSALNTPFQSFGKHEFYPTLVEKAVRLCYGLVMNHPFHDGNKRIGTLALLTTLDLNHIILCTNSKELSEVVLHLAAGEIDYKYFLSWVQTRID
jgi:death-on-curing protein